MKFTIDQIKSIEEKYNSIGQEGMEFEEVVELIIDHLLDETIVDISDDEYGDAHEDLYNSVWDYLETNAG